MYVRILTAEEGPGFGDHILYMHWGFFSFCRDITTGCNYDEWLGIAVGVFQIKSVKEDGRSGNYSLTKPQFFTQF